MDSVQFCRKWSTPSRPWLKGWGQKWRGSSRGKECEFCYKACSQEMALVCFILSNYLVSLIYMIWNSLSFIFSNYLWTDRFIIFSTIGVKSPSINNTVWHMLMYIRFMIAYLWSLLTLLLIFLTQFPVIFFKKRLFTLFFLTLSIISAGSYHHSYIF